MSNILWGCIALLILYMPIIFGVKLYFDKDVGELQFSIFIYRTIKILSGKVKFTKKRAVIRVGKKRLSFHYKQLFDGQKKLDIFKQFEICDIFTTLEIGSNNDRISPLLIAAAYNTTTSIALANLKNKNSLLDGKNNINVYDDKSVFKYKLCINFLFNVLLLLIAILKKVLEKIINGKRKN